MKAWAVTKAHEPLELLEFPTPEPTGSEVLVEVTHCGVCHSDLHFWEGEYNLGGGKVMKLAERGVTLPRAPGHEIAGRVVAAGPLAQDAVVGEMRVVYPWIGCGKCAACARGEDNFCTAQQQLGVLHNGGFGSHVLVPHPRYLVDPGNVDPGLAATYACSGITTYSAVSKIMPLDPQSPVVLIGAGGLGLMAIAMLHALGHEAIFSVDVSEDKRAAVEAAGATFIPSGEDLAERILAATGGPVPAVIDFVNMSATARAGYDVLTKGGKLIAVGVTGGELTVSLATLIFRAASIIGTNTGSLGDLHAVIALANEGRLKPTPITTCPKSCANQALNDLAEGKVTGRIVLTGAPE